jgi:hypothetical protein
MDLPTARQRRNRAIAARRLAHRHAIKAAIPRPRCVVCDGQIEHPLRLTGAMEWARRYCCNACRQEAWRTRHGE